MQNRTLGYLIDNIIKDKFSANECWVDIEVFQDELKIDYDTFYNIESNLNKNTDLRAYYIASHICTDTEVGILAYFLKDELVCVTKQSFRKSRLGMIGWVSKEKAEETKEYLLSLVVIDEDEELELELLEFDYDMGIGYPVEYTGQNISNSVIFEDEVCRVIEDNSKGYTNFHNIVIVKPNGDTITVDIRDCKIPYRITENSDLFSR